MSARETRLFPRLSHAVVAISITSTVAFADRAPEPFSRSVVAAVSDNLVTEAAADCGAMPAMNVTIVPTSGWDGVTSHTSVCAGAIYRASIDRRDFGSEATITWSVKNGGILNASSARGLVDFVAGSDGTTEVTAHVTRCGRTAAATVALPVLATPDAPIVAPIAVDAGSTGTASVPDAGTGAIYYWTITGGTVTSGNGSRSITFDAKKTDSLSISVLVRNACGRENGSSAVVAVSAPPPSSGTPRPLVMEARSRWFRKAAAKLAFARDPSTR